MRGPPRHRGRPPSPRPAALPVAATLRIESMAAQGDGLATGPIFVPLTLPGERILALVEGERAELEQVLEASPERVTPPCPHFGACGGCALQHWDHALYLAWKVEQVRQLLARERIETDFAPPSEPK